MSNNKTKSRTKKEAEFCDPDPLTIAISIINAVTPVGSVLADKTFDHHVDKKKRKESIRNALYDSYRAINETERILKDFVSYLDQQGLLAREFRLGRAPFVGESSVIAEIKNLHKDSYNASKDLGNAMIILSKYLDDRDFYNCARFAEKLNQYLHDALTATDYKSYAVSMSRFIQEAHNLIVAIGEKYGFQPSNLSQ